MRMAWHDLAFLHWPLPAAAIAERLPEGLEVDTYGGEAWIGVVPFRMTGVTPRFVPPLPGVSAFPEINLRTYVRHGDKAGVWFFSLDVTDWLPVQVARRLFHLPYFHAAMHCRPDGDGLDYRTCPAVPSRRKAEDRVGAVLRNSPELRRRPPDEPSSPTVSAQRCAPAALSRPAGSRPRCRRRAVPRRACSSW
ncbi:hypothetical protein Pla86_29840 [Planctomycetes bacterium Pla86]|uniref:DUF2071 domain-containing protein n=1 Tax=Engelhardtia mirabilis TaxID=2528011 RepID=A0A518BLQ4_9BACT|nr:hypothetical protein Pla133_29850 [Planctomycetes bacterium Pla133]QDV02222.1 hypothetical protein Pla86_29840 [Planctomycetes bacterium Pla86]